MLIKWKARNAVCLFLVCAGSSFTAVADEFCVVNETTTNVDMVLAANSESQFISIDPTEATLNVNGTNAICATLTNPGTAPPIWPSIVAQFGTSQGYVMQLIICDPSVGPLEVYFNPSWDQPNVDTSCGSPNVGFAGRDIGDGLYVNSVETGSDGVYRVIIGNQ